MKGSVQRYMVTGMMCLIVLVCTSCKWGKEKKTDTGTTQTAVEQPASHLVKEITSVEEFNKILVLGKGVIAKFHAVWCPPCRLMGPLVEKMAAQFRNINFVSLNTENPALQELVEQYVLEGIPMFVFFDPCSQVVLMHPGGFEEKEFEQTIRRFSTDYCSKKMATV